MSTFKKLPITELVVDDRYQRDLDTARVERMVKNFDPARFGVLEVSQHDGHYSVFDGQHRLVAARKRGMDKVPCLIHAGLSSEDEARLFVALQQGRKGINPVEKFRARVFAGDADAQDIDRIVTDCGFIVSNTKDAGGYGAIRAITAVQWIYRVHGAEGLIDTLRVAHELWFGDQRSTDGYLLQGLAQFLDLYGNRVGDEEMQRLRAESPTAILRRALGPMQGGGVQARHAVDRELRKVAGVRGRPSPRKAAA